MNWILIKAVRKARKNDLFYLVEAVDPVRLDCLADKCAKCCQNLGSPVVTKEEAQKIDSEYLYKKGNSTFVKSKNCTCCLLKNNLCSVYQNRPKGCREYPWYNIDSKLYYDSGCPGIKHDIDDRPAVETIQPFENFFPQTPKLTLWLIKKICIKK